MMKTLYSILITCFYIILLAGCDIVEPPYTVSSTGEPVNPGPGALRKVLLEDFTGHQCGNCPSAAYLAQELKDLYGDQLIIYAAHVGSYAFPDITPYLYDFRCVTGNEIADQFGITSGAGIPLPVGMVNRKEINGNPVLDRGDWGTTLGTILANPAEVSMDVSSSYNSSTRELAVTVNTEFLQAMDGTYNLCVFMTEDSIVKWQKIYPAFPVPGYPTGDVEDYVHRHVLRGSMNNTWGDEIAAGSVAAGDTVFSSFTATLDTGWVENKMSVVAYVYDFTTKEIIQAEEEHLH
jgi:hypothetical protein